ncbi:hypothetical protein NA57DRAFT_76949 [Rhizodiscina lignyota]|uniref:Uncharacterized protein n=1 Tax=Rhizodiscina lignyota TaxID=1504668 RepID=A0A9P4M5R9_9PEZI|nr:hypothetical protein NA57DRAFT_76949 [Rhizodiscina lignyota]
MARPLLFCIADEAKPFARKLLHARDPRNFYLADSRACPSERPRLKTELKDDETLETDFIGASEEDCQQWSLEMGPQVKFIEYDIIAIADARSAKDDILSLQYYPLFEEPVEYEKFGPLPPRLNVGNNFRIDYKDAFKSPST